MLDSLFEGSALKRFLVRWFGRERPTNAGRRGRQARLAIVDAANVDGRRKLVLIRRDNLEHLVLIGGPSDVLIEPNIAAGAAPPGLRGLAIICNVGNPSTVLDMGEAQAAAKALGLEITALEIRPSRFSTVKPPVFPHRK